VTRTIYFTASSLDGFIAGPGNDLEWLVAGGLRSGPDDSRFAYPVFQASVGAVVLGAHTYEWMLRQPQSTQQSWHSQPSWVVTHRTFEPAGGAPVRFFAGDVADLHPVLVDAAGGRDVWVVGGGDLAGQFLDAGLLDEMVVSYAPVTLGAGAPLLPRRANWRLVDLGRLGDFAAARWAVAGS
jgi:dihydrofolate reductase